MRKLSEAEWISRFEQVQGRKPKPDELQLAYQSGLIGISKNYNYIYILLQIRLVPHQVLHRPEIRGQVNLAVQVLTHLMLTMPRKPILKIHVGPMIRLVDLLV